MKKKIVSFLLSLVYVLAIGLQASIPSSKAASSALQSNQIYYIKNKRTGKYLTASSSSSGATLSLQNFSKGNLQKFKFVLAETTSGIQYYTIVLNSNNNLKVNVTNSSNADGVRIGLTTTVSPNAQRFRFILNTANGQNSYRIMPKLSTTRVFSIADNLGAGVPVYLYGNNSSSYHQDWIIENINLEMDVCPNVKINFQTENDTCGCACVRNILTLFNLNYSETTIKRKATDIANTGGGSSNFTFVWVLKDTINYFLSINNISVRYNFSSMSDVNEEEWYGIVLVAEANAGYPIIFNGNFTTNSYVPHSSNGHYVLGTGIKSPSDYSSYTAIISDVYKYNNNNYAGIWEMPLGKLKESNQMHSSGGYIIGAEITL